MPNPLKGWAGRVGLGLLLLLAGAGLAAWHMHRFATTPLGPAAHPIMEVPQGRSFNQVVDRMKRRGWIHRSLEMKVLGRFLGVAPHIHAGEYRLQPDMTPMDVLEALVGGHVVLHSVTLPEGWTVRRFLKRLQRKDNLNAKGLSESPKSQGLLALLGLKKQGYESAEGWLFPETYRYPRGEDAGVILKKSHQRMESVLKKEWADREEGLPFDSPYKALILASIVEKETAVPKERGMIAGVFVNRLEKGMRLQTDPTV
ncbi:MAG TPA: endolytic transglycosylase MltG, partial [Gammaproteobacteria bacterium]|nr:endolytic transglycosylase MltG [Gammaproteobacteria bacterium]